jgi:hypothetical protein
VSSSNETHLWTCLLFKLVCRNICVSVLTCLIICPIFYRCGVFHLFHIFVLLNMNRTKISNDMIWIKKKNNNPQHCLKKVIKNKFDEFNHFKLPSFLPISFENNKKIDLFCYWLKSSVSTITLYKLPQSTLKFHSFILIFIFILIEKTNQYIQYKTVHCAYI